MGAYEAYKKRHMDRKRKRTGLTTSSHQGPKSFEPYERYAAKEMKDRPSGGSNRFLIRCVLAAVLVLAVSWINRQDHERFQRIQSSIETAMSHEFQFAAVADWYQKNLGEPVGFLPDLNKKPQDVEGQVAEPEKKTEYAVPVNGEITGTYNDKTKGVTVSTTSHSEVSAVQDGLVVFAGEKKDSGRTVVIQHKDNTESWYGKLDETKVKVYETVKKGQKIGTTSGDKKGNFYFALKKEEKFIDPIQVMSFD